MKNTLLSILLFFIALTTLGCLDPSEDGNLVPRTVDKDPSLPRVALNGSVFHAQTFGDPSAPVIVMLHGGPGGDYRGLLRLRNAADGNRLEDHHFVVFWDQRGSGLSRRHDAEDDTMAAYDADLLALIDEYSPGRPVVLIGHSWGGMYASRSISLHPDRVAGAALLEPGPLTGALFEDVKSGIAGIDLGSEWFNDYAWAQTIVSPDDHARADYLLMVGRLSNTQPRYHLSETDLERDWRPGAVARASIQNEGMSGGKAVWDFTKGLDQFPHPVLFEASEKNEVIGVAFQKRQLGFYADASLSVIAGAGHDFQWVEPEATLRPIFDYLAAIGF